MKLSLSHIKKSFGAQDVLVDASIQIKNKEKVAIVGKNGCGKSTLLKIIDGSLPADSGNRIVSNQVKIGVIDQIIFKDLNKSVHEELLDAFSDVIQLEKELQIQAKILEQQHDQQQLKKYEQIQLLFESKNGYQYETELKNVFFHFQFDESDLDKPLSQFSSGQRTRIALVKLLLSQPDILLLDEPTNHLDIESIEWLENYIRQYQQAVILVSHDRTFLDHVADEIVEIEYGSTTRYPGNYSHYVLAKEQYLKQNEQAYARQQKEIERLETLIDKFRSKKNKAAFAKSKQKYLDRMDKVDKVHADTRMMTANFTCLRPSGQDVLMVDQCCFGYDSILTKASFQVKKGDRLAIIGSNGIGKSTILKTLMNQIDCLDGQVKWGHHVDIGYFDQESALNTGSDTILDTLWEYAPNATQTEIRSVLARFLFTQEEVFKEISVLSGGEKVRLALAILMIKKDNVLVLDEPTNHLDIPGKEALEQALLEYPGTILFISHDRMFLDKMATSILEVNQTSTYYPCSYQQYLNQEPVETIKVAQKEQTIEKIAHRDRKAIKNRIMKLEEMIKVAEEELEELRELRYEPEYYQDYKQMDQLNEQIDEKHNEIARYMNEWEEKMNEMES